MRAFDRIPEFDTCLTTAAGSADAWAALAPSPECCLTSKDYTLLEGHLVRIDDGAQPLLARLVRMKLARARVVLTRDVDPEVATGGSRIVFSTAPGEEQVRMLVHWSDNPVLGACLRIMTLPGATLLGMRAGQSAPLLRADGTIGQVVLKDVAFQPEAAAALARRRGV